MGRPTKLDLIFDPVDNAIYFLIGRRVTSQAMTWKTYTIHMLVTNLVMAIIIYLVLWFQNHLPLNQLNFAGVDPLLAFNTTASFITNTNWQAYGDESTLSSASAGSAVSTAQETMIPFSAFSHFGPGHTPLAVNHQGLFVASTISFNLQPGASLSDAVPKIEAAMRALHAPPIR